MGNRKKTPQEKFENILEKAPKGTKKYNEARKALLEIYDRQRNVVVQHYRQNQR